MEVTSCCRTKIKQEWCPGSIPSPSPSTSLPVLCSCLSVFPGSWPEAHEGPTVLHLLQVLQADVLLQLNHFVLPENVGHPMVGEDDDIELVLQLPLLWVDKGGHHSRERERDREGGGKRGRGEGEGEKEREMGRERGEGEGEGERSGRGRKRGEGRGKGRGREGEGEGGILSYTL